MKNQMANIRLLSLKVLLTLAVIFSATAETQAGSIEGYVKQASDNSPVSELWVDVYDNDGNWLFGKLTDVNGLYTLASLDADDYKVHFYSNGTTYVDQWYYNQSSFSAADPITVPATGTVTLADALLIESASTISGTVQNTGGQTIQGVYVQLYNSNGELVRSDTTDEVGGYTLIGLGISDGSVDYTLRFSAVDTVYITEWYDNKDENTADTITIVTLSDTLVKDAVLELGGSISGNVRYHETGSPVAGAWIEVYDSDQIWRGYAETDGIGDYQVTGLPAGTHKMEIFESYEAALKEWYKDKADFNSATGVSVTVGADTSGIDVVLGGSNNNYPVVLAPIFFQLGLFK